MLPTDEMPVVLYRHDDGRWLRARVLQQSRVVDQWRVLVTYSTAPGFTFHRGEWADSDRLARPGEHAPAQGGHMAEEIAAAQLRGQTR